MIIAPGTVDVITYFKLVDPATGVPETGLTISNLDATYIRDGAAAVKADLSTPGGYTVISAHTDNAAIQVDATNAPGVYRVDWPDAAFAVGVPRVQLVVNGAAIDPAVIEVELAAWLTPITGTSVGIDFNKVTQATGATTLTNITVPTVTSVTGGALEATLTAMKGAGWTIETLKAIYDQVVLRLLTTGYTAPPSVTQIADQVWDELIAGHLGAGSTGLKLNTAAAASGAGAITWPYTLTSSVDATPIADADVWVTSDLAGAVVIASGTTNTLGVVTFYLDAGTVYIWRQKTGWDFTNPDTETVS